MTPTVEIHCQDALEWLESYPVTPGHSLITSLPDVSEVGKPLEDWKSWFVDAAARVMQRCPRDGVAIFYQTDIKVAGHWVDKAHLCLKASEKVGIPLIWHKIVCRVPPGNVCYARPSYSHVLCFAPALTWPTGRSTADVITDPGPMAWARGIGLNVVRWLIRFVREEVGSHTVVDPFCGLGTLLWIAHQEGLAGIGVDLSPKRCRKAREGLSSKIRAALARNDSAPL